MVETVIFAAKVTPIVFLAGLAIAPISGFEDGILRTAAGVLALGTIYRLGVKPVYSNGRKVWMNLSTLIERFFEEHHQLITDVSHLKNDVVEIKQDVRELKDAR